MFLARLAGQQHGIVTRAQLLALGIGAGAIEYRVRAGRLHLLHRGVYAVGHRPPSPFATAMAAVLACGPGAVLSHRSAAAPWRIVARWPPQSDVTAPGRRRHRGIRVHRSTHVETTINYGIRVTTPAQTLLDLADVLPDKPLARAVNEAYVLKLTKLEEDFVAFAKRHRLPFPETGQRIAGHLVDFVWREQRLVAELDGYEFHNTRQAFETDRDRDADLLSAGFRTIRITSERLERSPTKEAKRLREVLAQSP